MNGELTDMELCASIPKKFSKLIVLQAKESLMRPIKVSTDQENSQHFVKKPLLFPKGVN